MKNTRTTFLIGILAAVVVALTIGLGMSIAMDWDRDMHDDSNPYRGMFGAMHDGDMNDMMSHMKAILSEEDFAAMEAHMQSHQSGSSMMSDSAMNAMMHRMMDSMMGSMMEDGWHHGTSTPSP